MIISSVLLEGAQIDARDPFSLWCFSSNKKKEYWSEGVVC